MCHGEDNSEVMLRCSLTDIQLTTAWRSTTVHSSTTTPLYRIQSLSEPHCMGKHIHKSYIEWRLECYMKHFNTMILNKNGFHDLNSYFYLMVTCIYLFMRNKSLLHIFIGNQNENTIKKSKLNTRTGFYQILLYIKTKDLNVTYKEFLY